MGANEKRINVQNLRPRRLVVGVVQTDQRISQKWAELTASLRDLLTRSGLDYPGQIRAHLQFGVTVVVNSGGPWRSFATAENRTWHFEFPKLTSQRDQIVAFSCSTRHGVQTVTQAQDRIERNQALAVQHRPHLIGDFVVHPLALWTRLPRTCEQIDDFILRIVPVAIGCQQHFCQRIAARVKELRRRCNLAERFNYFLPRLVQRSALALSLTGQKL